MTNCVIMNQCALDTLDSEQELERVKSAPVGDILFAVSALTDADELDKWLDESGTPFMKFFDNLIIKYIKVSNI